MTEALVVGAVAYSAKVVPIWEGIRDYFDQFWTDALAAFKAAAEKEEP